MQITRRTDRVIHLKDDAGTKYQFTRSAAPIVYRDGAIISYIGYDGMIYGDRIMDEDGRWFYPHADEDIVDIVQAIDKALTNDPKLNS